MDTGTSWQDRRKDGTEVEEEQQGSPRRCAHRLYLVQSLHLFWLPRQRAGDVGRLIEPVVGTAERTPGAGVRISGIIGMQKPWGHAGGVFLLDRVLWRSCGHRVTTLDQSTPNPVLG